MVRAVVEVVHDIAASGPVFQVTTQFGAVWNGVPKVTTQEVEAVLPWVKEPWKSVREELPPVPAIQAERTGAGALRVVERRCPGM
jgi:hypothetical protein